MKHVLLLAGMVGLTFAGVAAAADITKSNITVELYLGTSWTGGGTPGPADVAVWSNNLTAVNATNDLGVGNLTIGGLRTYNPGGVPWVTANSLNTGAVTADSNTYAFTYSGTDVANSNVVTFKGTSAPGGLTLGQRYYVVNVDTNAKTYQVASSPGGAAVAFTSNGVNVTNTVTPVLLLGASGVDMTAAVKNFIITAPITLTAAQTWDVASGKLLDSNNNSNNGGLDVDNQGYTLTVQGAGTVDLAGLSGAGGLIKSGNGVLNLHGGTYTYTGDITLNSGLLSADSNASALGSGASKLTLAGGTLTFKNNVALNFGRNATVTGDVLIYNNNSTSLGAGTYTIGTLSIGANTLTINANGSNTGTVAFTTTTLTGDAIFAVTNRVGNYLALGAIGGSYGFTKTGVGTLWLNGSNTYSGATLVQAGTLALTGTASFASSTNVFLGATATLDATRLTSGGVLTLASNQTLSGGGTVQGGLIVAAGATLMPSTNLLSGTAPMSVTNLTLAGTWQINIANTSASYLNLGGGTLTWQSGAAWAINDDQTYAVGQQFVIATNIATLVGTTPSTAAGANNTYDVVTDTSSGTTALLLTVTAVPEPVALGLLGLLAGAGWLLRRRPIRGA